jgi:hypothetical protein
LTLHYYFLIICILFSMISSCLQSFSRTQGFTIRHEVTRYMTHVSGCKTHESCSRIISCLTVSSRSSTNLPETTRN